MYTYQSLQDILFLMLYGGTAMLALAAGIYLWLRRSNAIAPDVTPPSPLQYWTAGFLIIVTLSHIWWYVLGVYWLTDDRMVRNITAVTLDHITLIPFVMAMLLRMLQDRQRWIWPWFMTQIPVMVIAALGIVQHNQDTLEILHYWEMTVIIIFVIYYIYALIRYGRWLHENYADLEHKEVWQSLLIVVALFIVYEIYSTNPGRMAQEYLAQVNTIVIVIFLLWRVETLQILDVKEENVNDTQVENDNAYTMSSNISTLLQVHCEAQQLYLQHDLTLQQLATSIGTNRTYLSAYFAQQGITYNAYINRLRIDHFIRLYRESIMSARPMTAMQIALKSGFHSYSTFSSAFKLFNGQTVTAWMKSQTFES